jgi:hypothetical protein
MRQHTKVQANLLRPAFWARWMSTEVDTELGINHPGPGSITERFKMDIENSGYLDDPSSMSPDSSAMYAQRTEAKQSQQVMATEFDISVKDWWIEGGRLSIPREYRQYFPGPGEPIVLIDYEGRMYRSKMHNLWQGVDVGRIDGIKPFYKNHPFITPGTRLHIKLTGKSTAVVMLLDRPQRSLVH